MPDENKKSRWDYLGKEPAEFVQEQKPTSAETAITEETKITKERIEKILLKFAVDQEWTFLLPEAFHPPTQGVYEFKSQSFNDARLFAKFDISSGGTTYLNFIFLIGGVTDKSYTYDLMKMNAFGFTGAPFFLSIQEVEGHKFLRLESWFVIPKDASDEAIVSALHGAFGTLFTGFCFKTPWKEMMKGVDIFLFPEDMQKV